MNPDQSYSTNFAFLGFSEVELATIRHQGSCVCPPEPLLQRSEAQSYSLAPPRPSEAILAPSRRRPGRLPMRPGRLLRPPCYLIRYNAPIGIRSTKKEQEQGACNATVRPDKQADEVS